jgi:PA14 domain/F5/8 type C domain/NHL repeat
MSLRPLLTASCALFALLIAAPVMAADFTPPLTRADLDPATFAAWYDGRQEALPADKLTGNDTPMWTSNGQAGWTGIEFGDSKKPGTRHLRIGFTKAITVGTVVIRGGNLSVLKNGAAYPGDLADDSQWLPAQRLSADDITTTATTQELVTWVLPPGTSTRALRITHVAIPTDRRYNGWLGGVWLLAERYTNLAPSAVAFASGNRDMAFKVIDQRNNDWDTWDNGEHGQEKIVSPESPAWVMLAWPQAQSINGLVGLSVGASRVEAQVCTAPADRHPSLAEDSQWRTVVPAVDADPLYPKSVGPITLRFPQAETTRGVRLRFLAPLDQARAHGHLHDKIQQGRRVWLNELLAFSALADKPLTAPAKVMAAVEQPPIAIPFTLAKAGLVTLVIEDEQGNRVRNLISETRFPAGKNTAWWDGLDDRGRDYEAAEHHQYRLPGALVAPGKYRVRGLVRDDLSLTYQFSFYTNGKPPWETADGSGWWLANHTPPQAAWFVPAGQTKDGKETMLIGSYVTEGGAGLAWLDLDGRKRYGVGWVGGNWTGAAFITGDRGTKRVPTWYAYTGSAFEGELRLVGLRPEGGDGTVLKWNFPSRNDSDLGGIAVHDGVLVASLPKLGTLLLVDVASNRVLGQVPCADARGVAFDGKGKLLVLSGSKLLRLTLPPDLIERGSGKPLDRATWKVSASSGNAAQAIDGKDDTRWDTQSAQKVGDWFQIEFAAKQAVGRVVFDARRSGNDFPRGYAVHVSDDGKEWGKPVVTGNGSPGILDIALPATTTRFVRIVSTGSDGNNWWSVNELHLLGPSSGLGTLASETVIAKGLEDPRGLCTDNGRIYVSDHGASHQVKVFGDNGALQRTIGKPGAPTLGAYDPLHMNQPHGMAVDSKGRLWVTECEHQPKRVSIWKADGSFEQAFYGPARYGEGGTVDAADRKRLFLMGMEFAIDWDKGTDTLKQVFWRPGHGLDLGGEFGPELLLTVQGREYLTNVFNAAPTNAPGVVGLWSYAKGVATPVAAAGRARDLPALAECFAKLSQFSARWTGKIVPTISGPVSFHTISDDGVRLWIDGKQVIDNWNGHGPTEDTGVVTLTANKPVDVKLEWYQGTGGACIKLLWSGAGLPKAIIPAKSLIPAGATAPSGLRGEFFFGQNFERSAFVRTDATIEIDVPNGGSIPVPGKEAETAAMQARLPAGSNFERDSLLFTWSDRNHDGKLNADELTFRKDEVGGMTVQPDLSLTTSTGLLIKPTGFDSAGVPLYDATTAVALVPGGRAPNTSGGGHTLVCADGWTVLTIPPEPFPAQSSLSGAKDGVAKWTYPNLWPGLHPSHTAPTPDREGQIIGTTRVVGHPFKPVGSDVGWCWAINGNKGNIYVFTTDGLFVATLFKDSRMFPRWAMPSAERGTHVEQTSLGEENFWPTMTQTADGKICLISGSSFVAVDGMESIRRLPDLDLPLTVAQLAQAQSWTLEQEAKRQQAQGSGTLTVALRTTPPSVDGALDDWAGADWATIDRRRQQVGDWGSKTELITGAVSISGDRLYAAWRTTDKDLLRNAGTTWQTLFKFGGCLDLMIGADPNTAPTRREPVAGDRRLLVTLVQGKPMAVLYTPVVPGHTGDRVPFVSPVSTLKMDTVTRVEDQIQLAGKDGDFELSVPLALLGLKPAAKQEIRADIGLLRGNGFATMQRVYWSNKATSITSDVPSEARMSPELWGRWVFTAAP